LYGDAGLEDDDGRDVAVPPVGVCRTVRRGSAGTTAAAVHPEQPAGAPDALRAAGATLVVLHGRREPLEHLALGLALALAGAGPRLQQRQKRMLVHGMSPDFVMKFVTSASVWISQM
jgi:hypothetical protein